MNRFAVTPGRETEFEEKWNTRESYLDGVDGFIEFHLLRGTEGEYVSHSMWESEGDFKSWMGSDNFKKAHSDPMPEGVLNGPPRFSGYEVVLIKKR
jgi:heme-degrading monooxygenase HmoA